MYAVKEDQVVIVKELLMSGADPTIRNKVKEIYKMDIQESRNSVALYKH